jgi:ribosomal protein S18 acetylase RimI-like enzyme
MKNLINELVNLRLAYLKEDFGHLDEKDVLSIESSLPDYFQRHLNQDLFVYTEIEDKKIVSCAFLLLVEKPMSPSFINGKTGIVLNVYTKPEYRHKGYARKVMNDLLEDAKKMELCTIELKSTDDGYSLYKAVGFKDDPLEYHFMKWKNES